MRKEYYKLVRDRIPEIIEKDGRGYAITTLSDEQFHQALRAKLVEEAQEAASAEPEKLVVELADLYEIVDAVLAAYGIERESVLAEQKQRRAERGGFEKRIQLLWTE
jgi:predicted house-cleaning noncanonical NTP pyrophosphatase (MazG superfamily)